MGRLTKIFIMPILAVLAGVACAGMELVSNASLDAGWSGWSGFGEGGPDFRVDGGESICSVGWTDGAGIWQDTGHEIEAGAVYLLTARVRTRLGSGGWGDGVRLTLQDVDDGWLDVVGPGVLLFPEEDRASSPHAVVGAWREASLVFNAALAPGRVGHRLAVGVRLNEQGRADWGETGWLDIDSVSLQIVPEPAALVLVGLGSLALRRRRRG